MGKRGLEVTGHALRDDTLLLRPAQAHVPRSAALISLPLGTFWNLTPASSSNFLLRFSVTQILHLHRVPVPSYMLN